MPLPKFILLTIFFLIATISNAQTIKNYEAEWKRVDELIQKRNLPKTALEEVKKIYSMAKRDKQDAQIIKALVYITQLQTENRENNLLESISEIEKEIALNKEPATSILKSYLAGLYWQYFQQQRWQIYNRSSTINFIKTDIATWSADDFHKIITDLYLQSIKNENVLKETKLTPYDAIIVKGNARILRPTLFDLLAHNALIYFKNDERDLRRPSYAFQIENADAFAPAEKFVTIHFETRDSLSLQQKALLIYQRLISFHLKDADPIALIDADLERLQFVYHNAVVTNKDELYQQALQNIIQKYSKHASTKQAVYLLALFFENQASQYNPLGDTTNRFARIKARNLLEGVVRDSAIKNEGWTNSYNLFNEILRKHFSFEVEKVNVPGDPFRALVEYRNINKLYFRLVVPDERLKNLLQQDHEKYWSALRSAKFINSWSQDLPATNDLQSHAVEIKVDALPVGEYILIASADDNFSLQKNALGAQLFYVSNISFIHRQNHFFVLHRQTGQPLQNAAVQVYKQQYNYNTSRYSLVKTANYKVDQAGKFNIIESRSPREGGYILDIVHNDDRLFLNEALYDYRYMDPGANEKTKETKKVFYFTDRSIYRPGQRVQFKGIAITHNGKESKAAPGYKVTVYLRDANYQLKDSMILTSNEFGSFTGNFQLPQNLLNGIFTITDKETRSTASFSVEEYKRPKFYTEFKKVKDTYKVGDTISIEGMANAYAGNVVDGAKVNYRVVREPRFIYPWRMRSWWFPQSPPMEIAHGETTTDQNGTFTIYFPAIPDLKIDRKFDPVFDYRIYADVTDINGETRSTETVVSAGYKSLVLQLQVPERVIADSLQNIVVRTENMNREFQKAIVTISITKLIPEQRLIRNRYWRQPDQFILTKEEYIRLFPHDEYKDENNKETWAKGEMVYTTTDSSRSNYIFPLATASLLSGNYVIEAITKDKEGNEVKDVRYVEVYNPQKPALIKPEYLWTVNKDASIEPGEKTSVLIGSSAQNVYMVHEIDKTKSDDGKEQREQKIVSINNSIQTIDFTAREEDRGGFGVTFFFIKDNRLHQYNDIINVPWSNKNLDIEFATFRDKTLPGSEEKWKVLIKGNTKDKLAAEMLASMYDASLDQFKIHNWNKPAIWPMFRRTGAWQGNANFSSVNALQKWMENDYRQFEKIYDHFFFSYQHRIYHQSRDLMGRAAGIAVTSEARVQDVALVAPPMFEKNEEAANGAVSVDTSFSPVNNPTANFIQVRKNFIETAFFFPQLQTDKDGNIEFTFTAPEDLTRWKLQTLSHTKDLAFGLAQKEIITQKELMVQPNMPRFLRQGDRLELTVKIANISEKEITGQAELQLFDASTNQPIDGWFMNSFPNQYFTVAAGQSDVVKFPIEIPIQFTGLLQWRIVARAGNLSDGEEAFIPVLTNRVLVTETLTLPVKGSQTKTFLFEKLLNANTSETLQHHALTVEYVSNPAWYVVQALPYLIEQKNESVEQVWNRYYANALASEIVNKMPRIKQIFEKWKTLDTAALLSNLQKNEELKSALLEETPWVLQAKSEEQQKKNIVLLFDVVKMQSELGQTLERLKQMQVSNGGFVWFKGAPDDRYMTQYIVTGIGHLRKLNAIPVAQEKEINLILKSALTYLDQKIKQDYDRLVKSKADLSKQQPGYINVQYLYLRSFFPEQPVPLFAQQAYTYYRKQSQLFWMKENKYMQGMIALALHRTKDLQTPKDILRSLKETALLNEELGMYWKDNQFGYSWRWWYAPIETQALLIEAFSEITKDVQAIDEMKTWLLKHKQTNNWRTSKATAQAIYAFLLQGTNWLNAEPQVIINLGNVVINSTTEKNEAGTGYIKKAFEAPMIKPEMANISVTVNHNQATTTPSSSWGAVYWQYFQDADKITGASTPLQLNKKLFIEKNTDRGPILTPITEGTTVNVGDKIKVRVELKVDRDMEYVHMKDMRASALEPVNVLSGYKWQGGLGYYETTKDMSTSFFFSYLPKGTYVFEYPLFVSHTGTFSNGITTIQSLYAPEFSAHSEGVKITVE